MYLPIPIFSPGSHGLIHSCLGGRVCIYKTKCRAAKFSLQHPGLPELFMTAGACSCPAGLLASSLAWFHPSVPQGVYHGLRRQCSLPPPSSSDLFSVASGRFRFLPTRWAAPFLPPNSSSAHNTALFLTPGPPGAICHLVSDSR